MGFLSPVPFGFPIIIAMLITFGSFYIPARFEISSLKTENGTLHTSIDSPTGYIVQLGSANSNLAVANKNIEDLTTQVSGLNKQIDSISAMSSAAVKRTQALQAALSDAQAKARSVAQLLEAQRPQVASYAALTGLIRQPVSLAVSQ